MGVCAVLCVVGPARSQISDGLVLGTCPTELSAIIWIAEQNGYFEQNGLNVAIQLHPSNTYLMNAMLMDKIDIVAVSEFDAAKTSLQDAEIRIIASIDKAERIKLVAGNIKTIGDLRGKKVGIEKGCVSEFHVRNWLDLNGVYGVEFVDVKSLGRLKALELGVVTAVSAFDTDLLVSRAKLEGLTIWPAQNSQKFNWLLVSNSNTVSRKKQAVKRFMKALVSAQEFIAAKPYSSKEITAKRLDIPKSKIDLMWNSHEYGVTLDQSLLLLMEEEARWLMSDRTEKGEPVNFLNLLHCSALHSVRPTAVNVIH